MITIKNMLIKNGKFQIKAFTLIESLLALMVITFLTITLSTSVTSIFQQVEEHLFLISFEHFYRDSQKLSAAKQQTVRLRINSDVIENGYHQIKVPETVAVERPLELEFSTIGGNSSLEKVAFQLSDNEVLYQLYLGSGKYRKTVR